MVVLLVRTFFFNPHYFSNEKYIHINFGPTLAYPCGFKILEPPLAHYIQTNMILLTLLQAHININKYVG